MIFVCVGDGGSEREREREGGKEKEREGGGKEEEINMYGIMYKSVI